MKVQWSLRTLLIVMTLGGPLLAAVVNVSGELARYLSPYEQVHCDDTRNVTWAEAMRDAQQAREISGGFQVVDKLRPNATPNLRAQNSLHDARPID
jgi:hypothetical protein